MSHAKALVIDKINSISDDMDEMQIIERLYMLTRLDHSIERCEQEGTLSTDDIKNHFTEKRNALCGD